MPTRIELCGALTVEVDGRRVEEDLPGRQGRLLFAYLALNRERPVRRDELVDVVWDENPPGSPDAGLAALLTRAAPRARPDAVEGRSHLRLALPDAWLDVEAARAAAADAEVALAGGDPRRAAEPAPRRRWRCSSGRCCPSSPAAGSTRSARRSTGCTPTRSRRWRARRCGSGRASCPPRSARRGR